MAPVMASPSVKKPPKTYTRTVYQYNNYMGVFKNSGTHGTPKSSILIGFSIMFTLHFACFPPIFGNTHNYHKSSPHNYLIFTSGGFLKKNKGPKHPKAHGAHTTVNELK